MALAWMLLCFVSVSTANVVTFRKKSLGISLSPEDADVDLGDAIFNTRVESVSEEAKNQGLHEGDVVIRVAGWSAKGASLDEVVEKIQKHKKRPLKITFATPDDEDDEDDDVEVEEADAENRPPEDFDPKSHAEAMRAAKKAAGWDDDEDADGDGDGKEEKTRSGVNSIIDSVTKRNEELRKEYAKDPAYRAFEEESDRAWREMVNENRAKEGLPPLEAKKRKEFRDTRPICKAEDLKPVYDFRLAVKFVNKSLGFTLSSEEVDAYSDGEWYHAVVEKTDDHLQSEGIQSGSVIYSINKWSAQDASVEEVVEYIKSRKKRPLKIFFLIASTPNHCRVLGDEDEKKKYEEDLKKEEELKKKAIGDGKDPKSCTVDAATGSCVSDKPTEEKSAPAPRDMFEGVLPTVTTIVFEEKALGIRINTEDANYETGGTVFNARIREVLARRVSKMGMQPNDVILRVNDWSTEKVSAVDVIDYIKTYTTRPMTMYVLPDGLEISSVQDGHGEGEADAKADAKADDSSEPESGDSEHGEEGADDSGADDSDAKAEAEADADADADADEEPDAKEIDTTVLTFKKKGLGIRLEKGNSKTFIRDAEFNARISKVVDKQLAKDGLKVGDVIAQVGEWSANGASIRDVVAQIKKHKDRPLKIAFATPEQDQDDDEFIF